MSMGLKICSSTRVALIFVLMLLSHLVSAETTEDQTLVLGVVPQQASEKLAQQWLPVAQYLSERIGQPVRFATAPNIPEFEKRLATGEYDLAYMNPYHFTVFNREPGYRALARQRGHQIRGIIVVSSDLKIESLEQLAGASIAFPAPNAFAATLVTRAFLDRDVPDYRADFVRSHDSVYRNVAEGLFDAGGGILRTLDNMPPEIRKKLEILWLSPGFTGHAIAAHPRVSETVRSTVRDTLIGFDESDQGRAILNELNMTGFQKAEDSDWDDVRALGIKTLRVAQ